MTSIDANYFYLKILQQQNICQIKLEFVNVMLQEAQVRGQNAGNCQSESLTVIGAANINGPLKVCGRLTGQHSKFHLKNMLTVNSQLLKIL